MENDYKKYFRQKHYSFTELQVRMTELKSQYENASFSVKNGRFVGYVFLQPTEYSVVYKIKIAAEVNSVIVNFFPVEPYIGREVNGKRVPHIYPDGSLCLFYPQYREWNYLDSWMETLIPWVSLWLYYYEIWIQTGEWLGGGVHAQKKEKEEKFGKLSS